MRSNNNGKLIHIKKLCNDQGHLQMLAIDQRPPIFNLIKEKKKAYTYKDVVDFKKQISLNLSQHSTAILMDPVYSVPSLIPSKIQPTYKFRVAKLFNNGLIMCKIYPSFYFIFLLKSSKINIIFLQLWIILTF